MLVSVVKVNSRLKMLKGIFNGIHGIPLMRMHRKNDTLPYNRGTHAIFTTGTKLLDIKSEAYRPSGDLVEANN